MELVGWPSSGNYAQKCVTKLCNYQFMVPASLEIFEGN
jgi:hypothetical protein